MNTLCAGPIPQVYLDRLHAIAPQAQASSLVSSVAHEEPSLDSDVSLSLSLSLSIRCAGPAPAPREAGPGVCQPLCATPPSSASPAPCVPETRPTSAAPATNPSTRASASATPRAEDSGGAYQACASADPLPGVGCIGPAEGGDESPAPAPRPGRRLSEVSLASLDLKCHSPGLPSTPGSVSKCPQSTWVGRLQDAPQGGSGGGGPMWLERQGEDLRGGRTRGSGGLLQLLPAKSFEAVPPPPSDAYPYRGEANLGILAPNMHDDGGKSKAKGSCRGCNCRKSKCLKL